MHLVHERVFEILSVMLEGAKASHIYVNFDYPPDENENRRSISYSLGVVSSESADDDDHEHYDKDD